MSRVQLIRRYEVEMTVASRSLSAGQLTEAAAIDADSRAQLAGKELGDVFRPVNEFEGIGMEIIHAE